MIESTPAKPSTHSLVMISRRQADGGDDLQDPSKRRCEK
jgi:hypothetical protein